MEYKDFALLGLGIMGVLLHNLVKISQLKKEGKVFIAGKYYSDEWPTMCISFCMVVIAIYCKHEIKELEIAGNYLGLGFVTLGYMGQSLLITFIGRAQKKAGIDDSAKALLLLVGATMLLSGCANEKKFVRFHDKHEAKALEHIVKWYPSRDSVVERLTVLPGRVDTIAGQVVYADCDSAYRAALIWDTAYTLAPRVIIQKVAVPCPPSTVRVDSFFKERAVYVANTARERQLELQCKGFAEGEQKAVASKLLWRRGALIEGGILLVLAVGVALRIYLNNVKVA